MSEHAEVVRDYVALRNFLARSNPKPNMPFEIKFVIEGNILLASNSITLSKTQLAKLEPLVPRLLVIENQFSSYTRDLTEYANRYLNRSTLDKSDIIELAITHRKSLGLNYGYEP
jgi:hypothetical protein